jgi:hypothetical protein
LKTQNIRKLNWIPTWNNILIENVRKFITLTTNVKDLKSFLNLNQNAKYQQLQVNNLNEMEGFFKTSHTSLKFKRKKLNY